jgi:hypothetical protein
MEMKQFAIVRSIARGALAASAILFAIGCGSSATTQPSEYDRQDKALKDPFGYTPDFKHSDNSVSGNSEFDKDAFKKDLDHVINP